MGGSWIEAGGAFAAVIGVLIIPGLLVRLAGWGTGSLTMYFLVPAISISILSVASNVAHLVGLGWSLLPVAILTAVACAVAALLRRWARPEDRHPAHLGVLAGFGGLAAATTVITLQLMYVFVGPDNISQTFDNIVHLNAIRGALNAGDASAFQIGSTSDIAFYPNGWHSVVTLVSEISGAGVPVAVNAANIGIGAFAWPASAIALSSTFFHSRPVALASTAALSTGFGAFPIMLFMFGVLYPNVTGYAILPAGIAAIVLLWRSSSRADRVRNAILLLLLCGGIGLGHPNAFLALYAIGAAVSIVYLTKRALRGSGQRLWWSTASAALVLSAGGMALWRLSETPYSMSRWGPWQTAAQSVGEALLLTPRQYPVTIVTAVLVVAGIVTIVRHPARIDVATPFLVAATLFVFASGVGVGNPLREILTRPWYHDSYRLAALLPIAGIPLATLGVLAIFNLVRTRILRRAPTIACVSLATLTLVALFLVAIGSNVTHIARDARSSYTMDRGSPLLTPDERALIDRLPDITTTDDLIAGSPATGTSLAFALADRPVMEYHIFGSRTEIELYLDENLNRIEDDPRVCAAIRETGVTHVLDFGGSGVANIDANVNHPGIHDLQPSSHLVLVDSEGPDARLFRVEGC
jgi:hypothetical protein